MGQIKKAIYKVDNGTDFDTIHFETEASMVKTAGSSDVEAQLAQKPDQTTGVLTYYVNSKTGNDSNNGTSSGTAFKTITKAIGMIPQIVNHTVTINVADGTYAESISINGFTGGATFNLVGNITTPANVIINNVSATGNGCRIAISGMTLTTTTTHAVFGRFNSNNFSIYLVNSTSACSSNGVYVENCCDATVTNCAFSNKGIGIAADLNSSVFSNANTGSGNSTGLYACAGAKICKQSTQPSGTTAETKNKGGQIISDIPSPSVGANGYRYNDDGSIEQWGVATLAVTMNTSKNGTITFPIAFPNNCLNLQFTVVGLNGMNEVTSIWSNTPPNKTTGYYCINSGATNTVTVHWRALGN